MRWIICLLFILFGRESIAQNSFPVKIRDFSDKYEALIGRNDKDTLISGRYDQYVPEYVIKIFDRTNHKIVLETYTTDFPTYLLDENNEAIPNVKELPYGSQSVLLYEDYNFDGIKDFALMNGNNSCYGGPSFDIYLAKSNSFEYSEAFSLLSNDYCGMFQVDTKTKTIHTMTKSGCCWHQFSEFKVVDNKPRPIKITEQTYLSYRNFVEVTEITYNGNKEKSTQKLYFPLEEMTSQILLYFEIEKNGKAAVLYEIDQKLHYVFLQKDDVVEFYFPPTEDAGTQTVPQEKGFNYNPKDNTLTFYNGAAQYQIYETDQTIGIKVNTGGKSYNLKGVKSEAVGSLKALNRKLTNVTNGVKPYTKR